MDARHVVFTVGAIVLDRLEHPVWPPVTASSSPSPATLTSSSPEVVSIEASGNLVAHRSGVATVRARGGSESILQVEVVTPGAIRAEPQSLALELRGSVALTVVDEAGRALPPSAVRWTTSNPNAIVVMDGKAHAFGVPGRFELTAEVGQARSVVPVVVGDADLPFHVSPPRISMKRGDLTLFRLTGGARSAAPSWRSDASATLAAVGDQGFFQAKKPGRARACARLGAREACSEVEVRP